MTWLTAAQALKALGVRPQTLYANVSRKRIRAKADPRDPRRSLYHEGDVRRLARKRAGPRRVEEVAAGAIEWGDPILPSALSTVAAGRLWYRGQDAVALAESSTLEDIASLLWAADKANERGGSSGGDSGRRGDSGFGAERVAGAGEGIGGPSGLRAEGTSDGIGATSGLRAEGSGNGLGATLRRSAAGAGDSVGAASGRRAAGTGDGDGAGAASGRRAAGAGDGDGVGAASGLRAAGAGDSVRASSGRAAAGAGARVAAGATRDVPLERAFLALARRAAEDPPTHGRSFSVLQEEAVGVLVTLADAMLGSDSLGAVVAGAPALHQRLADAWNRKEATDTLRRALVLLADHELNASTFAARVAVSTGASLAAGVLAGLATLTGPLHGGASAGVRELMERAQSQGAEAAVRGRLAEGRAMAGFGHPLYPAGDPRATALLRQLALPPEYATVRDTVEVLVGERPNIDFALAALTSVYALPSEAPIVLFAMARSVGWLAHELEQVGTGRLIRPRARYTGPPPAP